MRHITHRSKLLPTVHQHPMMGVGQGEAPESHCIHSYSLGHSDLSRSRWWCRHNLYIQSERNMRRQQYSKEDRYMRASHILPKSIWLQAIAWNGARINLNTPRKTHHPPYAKSVSHLKLWHLNIFYRWFSSISRPPTDISWAWSHW